MKKLQQLSIVLICQDSSLTKTVKRDGIINSRIMGNEIKAVESVKSIEEHDNEIQVIQIINSGEKIKEVGLFDIKIPVCQIVRSLIDIRES